MPAGGTVTEPLTSFGAPSAILTELPAAESLVKTKVQSLISKAALVAAHAANQPSTSIGCFDHTYSNKRVAFEFIIKHDVEDFSDHYLLIFFFGIGVRGHNRKALARARVV